MWRWRARWAPSPNFHNPDQFAVFILPILVLVFWGWGAKTWLYNRTHVNTDNAQVDGSIVAGLAKVGGFVKAVRIVENQAVQAGDVLVEIDDAEYVTRLAQSDAQLAAAAFVAGRKGGHGSGAGAGAEREQPGTGG